MTVRPVLWMPTPRQLRAGAVWVTAQNWLGAAQRRFGDAVLMTPDGVLSPADLQAATHQHGSSRSGPPPSRARILAETFTKDVRWLARDLRVRLDPPSPPCEPLFVWQHHDLFQTGGGQLARKAGVPLVQFVDAPYVWEAAKWGTTRPGWGLFVEAIGETRELHRADLVLCVSDEVGEKLADMGVHRDRILVTPCTADPADHAHAQSQRAAMGLEGKTVIGWLGSFRSFHRLDLLAEAIQRASERVDDLALLLVGDGAERDASIAYAQSLGIHTVAPGSVPHEQVPDWLATMDVAVILADQTQTFHYSPLKLKEYMAAGCAVVAPRLGEMGRVLEHGQDAMLYEPGDIDTLADHFVALAGDAEKRKAIGDAAVETVRQQFSVDKQLTTVLERIGLA